MLNHSISIISADGDERSEFKELLTGCITHALSCEDVKIPFDICVMLTDDEGIRVLNRERRDMDKPTDVLSFPMLELVPGQPIQVSPLDIDPETGLVMLGDIVISTERARAQAEEYGHSLERELSFLTVHAVLHLLGYDHEQSKENEIKHFGRQDEILNSLGIIR